MPDSQYINTQLFWFFFTNWQLAPAGLLSDLVTAVADWHRLNLLTDSRRTSPETQKQIWNWLWQLPHPTHWQVHCHTADCAWEQLHPYTLSSLHFENVKSSETQECKSLIKLSGAPQGHPWFDIITTPWGVHHSIHAEAFTLLKSYRCREGGSSFSS